MADYLRSRRYLARLAALRINHLNEQNGGLQQNLWVDNALFKRT